MVFQFTLFFGRRKPMKKEVNDPGLGSRYNENARRLINKDGSFNVIRRGAYTGFRDAYHYLVRLNWIRFNALVAVYVVIINSLFALLYLLIGVEHIRGIELGSGWENFLNAFYFSIQTFSSVGYGYYSPEGHAAHLLASFEAIFGLMSFALATGLIYGRFSKPKSRLTYSRNLLVLPYKEKTAMMFRVANQRHSVLMEMKCTVLLTMLDEKGNRQYFALNLEIDSIQFFPISWTIVHIIDDQSPFYSMSYEQILKTEPEVMIKMKGYDETFTQEVHSRYSYLGSEFLFDRKFLPCFETDVEGNVILHLDKISDNAPVV